MPSWFESLAMLLLVREVWRKAVKNGNRLKTGEGNCVGFLYHIHGGAF